VIDKWKEIRETVPCKECLVKAICIGKLNENVSLSVSALQCPILTLWLNDMNYRLDISYPQRLKIVYTELRIPHRSPA
jgi:hypothetical protein